MKPTPNDSCYSNIVNKRLSFRMRNNRKILMNLKNLKKLTRLGAEVVSKSSYGKAEIMSIENHPLKYSFAIIFLSYINSPLNNKIAYFS